MAAGITVIYGVVTFLIRDGHHRDGKRLDKLMKDAGVAEEEPERSGSGYWIRQILWWLAPTLFTLWLSIAGVQIMNAASKVLPKEPQSRGVSDNTTQPATAADRPPADR